jgi:integrase
MPQVIEPHELKPGLLIFRRADVKHRQWYCRIKIPREDRYKTISLKTTDLNEARDKAFDQDAEVRFRLKHEIPVFDRTFSEVAEEFAKFQKERHEAGEITFHRARVVASHIKTQLNPYVGPVQITQLGEDRWKSYPAWRQKTGKGRSGGRVSVGTIRDEMATFRSIMNFAAVKNYIRDSQVFEGKLVLDKTRREEFTAQEYRKLHSFARAWIKEARNDLGTWYRVMAYNFILIMTNTGMRPSEAKNLRWRDIATHTDRQGRKFVRMNVRGKGKHRELVAPESVATYLDRIRENVDELAKKRAAEKPKPPSKRRIDRKAELPDTQRANEPDDFVFVTDEGKRARTLYYSLIERLLIESELQQSSSGSRRSTYCFRHTYATFRLAEGVDVYFLAKQMGTSVKMIEDHYGHVTPVKNADRILQGLPGWEPIAAAPQETR